MRAPLRLALAQIRSRPADVPGNRARVLDAIEKARDGGAGLVVLPELALVGYTPADLLHRRVLIRAEQDALLEVAQRARGIQVLIGATGSHAGLAGRRLMNCAYLLREGSIAHRFEKALLPHYDIFDEARHFEAGETAPPLEIDGWRVGVSICEDLWCEPDPRPEVPRYLQDACALQAASGAEILLNLSASPYQRGRPRARAALVERTSRRTGCPVVLCNLVGGHDELLFDGASVAASPAQGAVVRLPLAQEAVEIVEVTDERVDGPAAVWPSETEELRTMLVLGLREYARWNGFERAVVGSSGGVDSALVAALAVDALGADQVRTVALPGPYSSGHSVEDAAALATLLGCRHDVLPIAEGYEALRALALQVVGAGPFGVMEENLQARTRGNLLMAIANRTGALLLTTGNKSELAVGYCTLYGDMCGGLAVIADLYKRQVYELARHYVAEGRMPSRIVAKEPSAELRPDQKDSDSLPPYERLDRILELHLEGGLEAVQIARELSGEDAGEIRRVLRLVARNEFKRVQAPPVLRVSAKAFGQGRRVPLIAKDLDWTADQGLDA